MIVNINKVDVRYNKDKFIEEIYNTDQSGLQSIRLVRGGKYIDLAYEKRELGLQVSQMVAY